MIAVLGHNALIATKMELRKSHSRVPGRISKQNQLKSVKTGNSLSEY